MTPKAPRWMPENHIFANGCWPSDTHSSISQRWVFTVSRSRVFDKTMVISNGAAGMPYRNNSAIFGSKNWFRKTESELLRAYE